ncbi:unnamed protein product, partial [Heligmosomoides polygyrus]|uniref:DUF4704 domain-containing protein n=1 Tax=Heligmosomoides polygyrus TaxID=6339 RepID=A0A183GFI8_HELPZ
SRKPQTAEPFLIRFGAIRQKIDFFQVITVCANIYPHILKWACGRKADGEVEKCWEAFSVLKGRIVSHTDSDNEGIRTMTFKFLEAVILSQSLKTDDSDTSRGDDIMSLNDVPRDHRFISYRKLQSEAAVNLQSLMDQTTLPHISAQNLLTVLTVLCTISRRRPEYMARILDCLEALHINLPPTLGASQVKSMRKELKAHLLRLLKHPSSLPLHLRITTLLTDLGASQSVRVACWILIWNFSVPVRCSHTVLLSVVLDDDEYGDDEPSTSDNAGAIPDSAHQSAIDITAEFIYERLNPKLVANLVLISLVSGICFPCGPFFLRNNDRADFIVGRARQGGTMSMHHVVLVRIATRFYPLPKKLHNELIEFIVDATQHRHRTDLALLWVTELYSQYQGLVVVKQLCVDTMKELGSLKYIHRDLRLKLIQQLNECTLATPPPHFVAYRVSLFQSLVNLSSDTSLLLPLAKAYTKSSTLLKKIMLRSIENSIKAIGMDNKDMLQLLDECPVGAESFVARVVHLLTERMTRMKKLHETRKTDVRSLIPILNGLEREDIVKILPQFILKPAYQNTVGLVFKRLLTSKSWCLVSLLFTEKPSSQHELLVHNCCEFGIGFRFVLGLCCFLSSLPPC